MAPKAKPRSRKSGPATAKPGRPATPVRVSGGRGPAYLPELKALIDLALETGISELEVQSAGRTFRIGRNGQSPSGGGVHHAAVLPAAPASAAAPAEAQKKFSAIKSPIVGTFYRAPAPDAESYIEEGQRVSIGQTVCIVEAMKLMNEIQSEVSGRVVRICIQNGQPVEYGQELFLVDPEG